MKLIITEDQFNRMSMRGNSSSLNIYERACAEANEKLNALYLKLSFLTIKEILEGDGDVNEIDKLAYKYHEGVYVMHRKLYSECEAVSDDEYYRNEQAIEALKDRLDILLKPIYEKYTVISDMASGLESLYSKVIEDAYVDVKTLFNDIRTIEI